ncbi:pyridoxine 5'-phosphate synthase [Flocculibacter collagenilyticus]|uniref:pyridoxine 5'-phosphate synthase n=1 Tax=Flocculibacter collagenilyticus TaxID=2744479 RepID=UPI0018F3818C|nr:pyridoxine 5'-phosphate synthase [Flocculibacter collagenilyticus]
MSTIFSVNLNKIALLRNSRGRDYPSVVNFAERALQYGCKGLTLHPRPDQRHARPQDCYNLAKLLEKYPDAELNLEGYPTDDFIDLVINSGAHQCTLVPDAPDQLTSDHGWDMHSQVELLLPVIAKLKAANIRTSIFIDPDAQQCALAHLTGTDRVELYTEGYAQAFGTDKQHAMLTQYAAASQAALDTGIAVNAGHDLNLDNLAVFLSHVPSVSEVSIGHAVIVEALQFGWQQVIERYVAICE